MKKLLVLVAVAVFVAGFSLTAFAGGPADVTFEAKMGNVAFPHAAHQGKVSDCNTCHHKGTDDPKCSTCHDGTKAPKAKDAFHKQCKNCHKKMGGPTGCKECHVK